MVTTPKQMLSIPPLENGDRLCRAEFERRYQAMPQVKIAELVEGVVYMTSPLRLKSHGEPHGDLITWLGTYKAFTPGAVLGDNPDTRCTGNRSQSGVSRFVVSSARSASGRFAKGAIGVAGRIEFNRSSRLCAAIGSREG